MDILEINNLKYNLRIILDNISKKNILHTTVIYRYWDTIKSLNNKNELIDYHNLFDELINLRKRIDDVTEILNNKFFEKF